MVSYTTYLESMIKLENKHEICHPRGPFCKRKYKSWKNFKAEINKIHTEKEKNS